MMAYSNAKKFYKNAIECAVVALVNNGRIFLVCPFYNYRPQDYAIPKGHVEKGEDRESAARREFTEETGIDISSIPLDFLCKVRTQIDEDTVKLVTVYRGEGAGDEKFKGANLADNGSPENIMGEYIRFEDAIQLIVPYQRPVVAKLMGREIEDFGEFLDEKLKEIM